jgi:hypothetical protein
MPRALWILLLLYSGIPCYGTSIAYPAFDTPVIQNGRIYAHHLWGHRVLCFDLSTKSVLWHTQLDQPIHKIWIASPNEIVLDHWGSQRSILYTLDKNNGKVTGQHNLPGRILGVTEKGTVFHVHNEEDARIRCYSYNKKKELWTFNPEVPNSNISSALCGDYLFIFASPRSIVTSSRFGKEETTSIKKGSNEIICLKASDASVLWREKVPLSKAGFGVSGSAKESRKHLLCVSDNAIRLLDKASGKKLKQYRRRVDIDGADFWGDDRIVICFGGTDAAMEDGVRTIRVIDTNDFSVLSEFHVKKREVASATVVGNILLLGSLYREMGIYLLKKEIAWTAYQRHQRIYNGLIYYGGHIQETDKKLLRVFGVCDPATGKGEILYSEPVK